jgi:hypothetical protein
MLKDLAVRPFVLDFTNSAFKAARERRSCWWRRSPSCPQFPATARGAALATKARHLVTGAFPLIGETAADVAPTDRRDLHRRTAGCRSGCCMVNDTLRPDVARVQDL